MPIAELKLLLNHAVSSGGVTDMNSVWNAWVDPANPPARACVRADMARPDVLVEIMVTAAK